MSLTPTDSEIEMKFDEMDHILDQISNYTNQGKANVFTKSKDVEPIPIVSTPSYVKPKRKISFKVDSSMTQMEKIATNHIFHSHPYNIKYHS